MVISLVVSLNLHEYTLLLHTYTHTHTHQRLEGGGVSAHTVRVVEEVFRRVGLGIHGNQLFTPQALLVFVHGLLSDSTPQLSSKSR